MAINLFGSSISVDMSVIQEAGCLADPDSDYTILAWRHRIVLAIPQFRRSNSVPGAGGSICSRQGRMIAATYAHFNGELAAVRRIDKHIEGRNADWRLLAVPGGGR